MMSDVKTTVILLLALGLSLLWVLRPVAPPTADEVVQEMPSAPVVEETAESSLKVNARKERGRERTVFQLNTRKSLEEQRLYELKLCRFLSTHQANWFSQALWMPEGEEGMAALERLAAAREERFRGYHEKFQILEDFVLDTEFTELSEEEADMVYRYYEFRKRIDEAFSDYFETPLETWLELDREGRRIGMIRGKVFELLERQYRHEVGGMTLEDATKEFLPQYGEMSVQTGDDLGRKIEMRIKLPQSGGI